MNGYTWWENIYSATDQHKIFLNKIEQGSDSLLSDLDIAKACEAIQIPGMLSSKWEIIMSHVSW